MEVNLSGIPNVKEENNLASAPTIPVTVEHPYTEKDTQIAEDRAKNPATAQSHLSSPPNSINTNNVDNFDLKGTNGVKELLLTPNVEGKYQAVAEMKKVTGDQVTSLSQRQEGVQKERDQMVYLKKRAIGDAKTPRTGFVPSGTAKGLEEDKVRFAKREKAAGEELAEVTNKLHSVQNILNDILDQISSIKGIREANQENTIEDINQ